MFCFLTVSTSVSPWQYTIVLQGTTVWDKLGKIDRRDLVFVCLSVFCCLCFVLFFFTGGGGFVLFLTTACVINNDLKTKSLIF